MKRKLDSEFVGGVGSHFGMVICTTLLSIIPIIGLPNAICIKERWFAKNTYIVGMKLQFNGTSGRLLGLLIKWMFFSIITIGIYSIWVPVRFRQWKIANTTFAPIY